MREAVLAELIQFGAQPMAERTFGSQLVKQLLGLVEEFHVDVGNVYEFAETSVDLCLGQQCAFSLFKSAD